MLARPGGTAKASAVLNAQFEAVETETALARTLYTHSAKKKKKMGFFSYFMGKISAGYVHDVGPTVMAKLHTNMYENTMMAFVIPL